MGGCLPPIWPTQFFFGLRPKGNSYRADEIAEISKKALIIEGGRAMIDGGGGDPYYHIDWSWYYYPANDEGSDLASSSRIVKTGFRQRASYSHDNYQQFWVMNDFTPSNGTELATKFNSQFSGKASMVKGDKGSDYAIVSFIDPGDGSIFKNFFKTNAPTATLLPYTPYVDEPNEYAYLTGNMNVLFGDGSVVTKSQAWLCNNRRKIALLSKE